MPKTDLMELRCEYCGAHDTFNVRDDADKIMPVIAKWRGVMDGDSPPNQGDTHRWYDTIECLISGEQKYDREKQESLKEIQSQAMLLRKANQSVAGAN